MANVGAPFHSKKLNRELYVRELTMESIIRCIGELSELLTIIDFESEAKGLVIIQRILQSEPTARAFRVFAAESTDTNVDDWRDVPIKDWLLFLKAARLANNWEELRELFLETGLDGILRIFQARTNIDRLEKLSPIPQPN